ncbi:hypothetical protein Bca52824_004732 [Brassica carinata]|uniref:Transmembrane protein n=1 Tax=Brassica carinata TaxID=52824 RepID=A0A8X8BGZ9_BRACI|nr:hypothetical protein Bca52824_004732 [Brassica carinata]
MAFQPNSDTTPPSYVAPRPWWSRPMTTVPPPSERRATSKECAAMCAPSCGGFFTVVVVLLIFVFIDKAHFHAKISLQSLAVSSATWQGDFLVKNPSSRYSIYYDRDGAAVRLGSLNVAVLNITSQPVSKDHTAFSLFFVADGNRSDVVSGELVVELGAKHKLYVDYDKAGHFNIRCQNVARGRGRIICDSSFTHFKLFSLKVLIKKSNMATTESGSRNNGPVEFYRVLASKDQCYIELFAHSISVSKAANVSTADWKTGLVAKSPATGCKLSLHTVTSRLLRGDEVISLASPSLDGFGRLARFEKTDDSVTVVDFRNVVTPVVNGSVVWDYRLESIIGLKAESAHGFMSVVCPDIPVKFTANAAGNVFGSLLGEQASTTDSGGPDDRSCEITPKYWCSCYSSIIIFVFVFTLTASGLGYFHDGKYACYIELFAQSVSVSNATNAANVTTADWRTGLVAKSPVTGCELSLHTVTWRLLRGDEVISQVSPSLDDFGFEKTDEPVTVANFKKVVTPVVNGSVVWNYRVESVVRLKAEFAYGFLTVVCRDIPVKFTADVAGNVVGSLLGVLVAD